MPATTTTIINYGQQYLAHEAPWEAALLQAHGDALTSPQVLAADQDAAACARALPTQTWPASDETDMQTLAANFDVVSEDIEADNQTKLLSDGTDLNAAANVVRAELGYRPSKKASPHATQSDSSCNPATQSLGLANMSSMRPTA